MSCEMQPVLKRILETAGGLRRLSLSVMKFTQLANVTKDCVASGRMETSIIVRNLRNLFARTEYDMCLSFPKLYLQDHLTDFEYTWYW